MSWPDDEHVNVSSPAPRAVLPLEDQWLWDFWFARDDERHHVYYLQADRGLGDPERRHWNVSIGHAVSSDLHHWQPLGTCLAPATVPAWDDCATWIGSVVRHPHGHWCLFYTGASHSERGLRQRIGLAESWDLHHWTRHSANPLLSVDDRYYETLDAGLWHDQAWRDFCSSHCHMFFTAHGVSQ